MTDCTSFTEPNSIDDSCARRGVIIAPGAIGDCIFTLPLAGFIKDRLSLSAVDMIARSEHADFYRGRSCIDSVRSIDTIDLHRLFMTQSRFEVDQYDSLVSFFSRYDTVVSFLGEPNSDFEANLIYTTFCSHPAEVSVLPFKPPEDYSGHISEFYIEQFIHDNEIDNDFQFNPKDILLTAKQEDVDHGAKRFAQAGLDPAKPIAIIHPGSGGQNKCWHLDNFLQVAKDLRAGNIQIAFLLGPAELERFDQGKIAAMKQIAPCICPPNLTEVVQLLTASQCFLGNDSGISHIAAGMDVPCVSLFGVTDHQRYRPVGPKAHVFVPPGDRFNVFTPGPAGEVAKLACEMLNR